MLSQAVPGYNLAKEQYAIDFEDESLLADAIVDLTPRTTEVPEFTINITADVDSGITYDTAAFAQTVGTFLGLTSDQSGYLSEWASAKTDQGRKHVDQLFIRTLPTTDKDKEKECFEAVDSWYASQQVIESANQTARWLQDDASAIGTASKHLVSEGALDNPLDLSTFAAQSLRDAVGLVNRCEDMNEASWSDQYRIKVGDVSFGDSKASEKAFTSMCEDEKSPYRGFGGRR